jgi:internalin A
MSLRAMERIREAAASEKTELDLSLVWLQVLPDELSGLKQLRKLSLAGNQLCDLPDWLAELGQLAELDLSRNQLTALPESLSHLAQLRQLKVCENRLESLPETLGRLARLQELDVESNQLKVLPKSIGRLSALRRLQVSNNQLMALPESASKLAQLQLLFVSNNKLTALPDGLGQLAQLQLLDVSRNQLSVLPQRWGAAQALEQLDLAHNDLASLPQELRKLPLNSLWLQANPRLGLSAGVLGDYPEDLRRRFIDPPPRDPARILEAYFSTQAQDARALNEVKLVLVGRGAAGKTSIARQLVNDEFVPGHKETPGIDIARWKLSCPDRTVKVNVWDFAGQVVTHGAHQFFLSESSVYVLVLAGREGTHRMDAEYWLKLIRAFAADTEGGVAPVIVVSNKFEEHPFKVDRRGLKERYPFIVDFVETDCESGLGIAALRAKLAETVVGMPMVRQKFKQEWWLIKEALEAQQLVRNHMPFGAFQAICAGHGVSEGDGQRFLAAVFHALGVALNYGSDARLRDATVLNPRWVTEGIYKLLRAGVDGDTAVLSWDRVARTLPDDEDAMRRYLVALMQRFDLAFPLGDTGDAWLVPQRLPEETPELDGFAPQNGEEVVLLRFAYPVVPEGLLPRFIVRTYPLSEGPEGGDALPRWSRGVALQQGDARALVRVDMEERQVNVTVCGEQGARLELLGVIQADLRTIHGDIKGLGETELLEVRGDYVRVQTLRADERAGNPSSVATPKGTVRIDSTTELNRLSMPLARDERARRARVFISYTSADAKHRDELLVRLKPLKETHGLLESWDDRCIPPGGDWDGVIRDELETADVVLLLVSARFVNSAYVRDVEIRRSLERAQSGACTVVPIIVEKVDWTGENFGYLNALPRNGKPVQAYKRRNDGWYEVGLELRALLEDLRAKLGRDEPGKWRREP